MCPQSPRRLKACLVLALCLTCALSLLPSPAAAVGLLDLSKAGTEQAAPAAPEAGLWTTLYNYFADLIGIAPPPPPPPDADVPGLGEDQGVTLDPNG